MTRSTHAAGSIVTGLLFLTACSGEIRVPDIDEIRGETPSEDTVEAPDTADEAATPAPNPEPAPEPESPAPEPPAPEPVSPAVFPATLSICPLGSISNAPTQLEGLKITNYQQTVAIEGGIEVAVAPVEMACFSSGFGPRGNSLHKGIDLYNRNATNILAAGNATVRQSTYRDDYGNMIVLDHGGGVFTRYAHLESIDAAVSEGAVLGAGQVIGVMGNTPGGSLPRHLHYEVLTGTWGEQAGSFSLTPVNIMALLPAN